ELPVGYTVEIGGQGSQLDRAFAALSQALALSIVLMYMPMAALYESFLFPLAVMICLPVALVGAFLGLIVLGDTINIFSMSGMITSTMLTLVLVPCTYTYLDDFQNFILRRRKRALPPVIAEPAPALMAGASEEDSGPAE